METYDSYERCACCQCCHCCHAKTIESCRAEHDSKMQTAFSPRAHTIESLKSDMTSEEDERKNEITSFVDNFAQSKRMYAENLQHQQFPGRVNVSDNRKAYRVRSPSDERDAMWNPDLANPTREREDGLYGHELGCKEPGNRMDLAIGWDSPTDSVYEPRRPSHVDGSEGDPSSAIFETMQQTPMMKNRDPGNKIISQHKHPHHDHPEYIRPDHSGHF